MGLEKNCLARRLEMNVRRKERKKGEKECVEEKR